MEDFWPIVAIEGAQMGQKSGPGKGSEPPLLSLVKGIFLEAGKRRLTRDTARGGDVRAYGFVLEPLQLAGIGYLHAAVFQALGVNVASLIACLRHNSKPCLAHRPSPLDGS